MQATAARQATVTTSTSTRYLTVAVALATAALVEAQKKGKKTAEECAASGGISPMLVMMVGLLTLVIITLLLFVREASNKPEK